MPKFRKKPVVIEAVQVNGSLSPADLFAFIGGALTERAKIRIEGETLVIDTLEGTMRADKDDWLIKGIKGEFYPCKPDIFEATYEAVDA